LHASIGYITPQDKLLGREKEIYVARDRKLARARASRKASRRKYKEQVSGNSACQQVA
jgi:hypothetical protein